MSDLIWLSAVQMRRIEPHFPLSQGIARVEDRQDYGPNKTIYNRFIR